MSQTLDPGTEEHSSTNNHSVSLFNIINRLGGVGRSILIHAVHEMDDVHDIRAFLCSCRYTHEVMFDDLFSWSIARGLSHTYSLRSIPIELTDAVCIFLDLFPHLLCVIPIS